MSYLYSFVNNIDWMSIYNKNINNINNNSTILDPISSIIRLTLLKYKPIGTKLSFLNNKIIFQEPDMFQSTKRWTSGDNRKQIHNLYNPIFKINLWYDISKPEIKYFLEKSKIGLTNLHQCYNDADSHIISHSINYYVETIDNILNQSNFNTINNINNNNNNNINNINNNNHNNNSYIS